MKERERDGMGVSLGLPVTRRRLLGFGLGTALAALPGPLLAAAAEMLASEEPHHHVIYDDTDMRLMRVMIPPGEATGWHLQSHDVVVTVLRGSKVRIETKGSDAAPIDDMVTDSVIYSAYEDKPVTRRVTNLSPWLNHQLAFEILTPKPGDFGPSNRSGAPGFVPILDNPRFKAWRLKLAPGEVTPSIIQSGPGVRIVLAGERMIDTPPRGTASENDVRAGDAAFLPPGTRSITNAGNAPLDIIEFELLWTKAAARRLRACRRSS